EGCTVVLPAANAGPAGFPVVVAQLDGPRGPEEGLIRSLFSSFLAAGFAVVAPVAPAPWTSESPPVLPSRGSPAACMRLLALLAGAGRACALDPARRVLVCGSPLSAFRMQDAAWLSPAFP